ncbi:MAG: mechanosensitive ion channel [Proteobacteria bacterium]|nr:mechanosensitive ion channel [Pseudomonadota bacterium]MCP4916197.1 mechanosensitive ion channel [Pseudomonadota bacterium]
MQILLFVALFLSSAWAQDPAPEAPAVEAAVEAAEAAPEATPEATPEVEAPAAAPVETLEAVALIPEPPPVAPVATGADAVDAELADGELADGEVPEADMWDLLLSGGFAGFWEAIKPIFLGLGYFLLGWMAAKVISFLVFKGLTKTEIDDWIADKLGLGPMLEGAEPNKLEKVISQIVFWTLGLFVSVIALEKAGFSQAAAPIQNFLEAVTGALPYVGKAALIMVVTFVAGTVLKTIVRTVLDKAGVDKRFAELSQAEDDAPEEATEAPDLAFSENAGRTVFWLVMLLGLASAADALNIGPIAESMRGAIETVVGFLPHLGVSIVILVGGYVLGRIARAVVMNVLKTAGFDKLIARIKMDALFGERKASGVMGLLVNLFVMLQALIAALNEVGLETLAGPLTEMMGRFWTLLPELAVSGFLLAVGVLAGRVLRGVVTKVLATAGFDKLMEGIGFGKLSEKEEYDTPSKVVGVFIQVGIILMATAQVLENLALDTWAAYLNELMSYGIKNVAVSAVILCIGFAVANAVRALIASRTDADADMQKGLSTVAYYGVLVLAATAAVRHLDVAEDFVLMTFALLFGSLCLATALAFGLGARDVAGEIVRKQYDRAKDHIDPVE